jgi:hypothetical protein
MIGFGSRCSMAILPPGREAEWAKLARQMQACPQAPWQQVAALFQRHRGVVPMKAALRAVQFG